MKVYEDYTEKTMKYKPLSESKPDKKSLKKFAKMILNQKIENIEKYTDKVNWKSISIIQIHKRWDINNK